MAMILEIEADNYPDIRVHLKCVYLIISFIVGSLG